MVPELPAELLVEVARRVQGARQLVTMQSVCRGWRVALIAQDAELWKPVLLRRFPRVEKMLELHRTPADYESIRWAWTHRVHCEPVNYRDVFKAQLLAEAPPATMLHAYDLPFLDDFIFTVEFVAPSAERGEHVLGSWTGTFQGEDPHKYPRTNSHPPMRITGFPLSADAKEFLRYADGLPPGPNPNWLEAFPDTNWLKWNARIYLASRCDLASVVKLYESDCEECDLFSAFFLPEVLPVRQTFRVQDYEAYFRLSVCAERRGDRLEVTLEFDWENVDGSACGRVDETQLISGLMSCLPLHVYF